MADEAFARPVGDANGGGCGGTDVAGEDTRGLDADAQVLGAREFDAVEDRDGLERRGAARDEFDPQIVGDLDPGEFLDDGPVGPAGGATDVEVAQDDLALEFDVEDAGAWRRTVGLDEAEPDGVEAGPQATADDGQDAPDDAAHPGSEEPGGIGALDSPRWPGAVEAESTGGGDLHLVVGH